MPVKYMFTIDLTGLPGDVKVQTVFDDFTSAVIARDKIMEGMTIKPVMSDPQAITDEDAARARRRLLEYTDTHGGLMSLAARQELESLRAEDKGDDHEGDKQQ